MNNIDTMSVNAIRVLAADAVQKANSGHPGLPLGCAAVAYELWAKDMKHNPLPDAGEGLDALLHSAIREQVTLEDLYTAVKSKRYAHARIRRLVLAAVLGTGNQPFSSPEANEAPLAAACRCAGVPYLRVLGATETGRKALSAAAGDSPIPVSPSLAALERTGKDAAETARFEAAAGDGDLPQPCGSL